MKLDELIKTLQGVHKGFGNLEVMMNGTGLDINLAFPVRSMSLKQVTETDWMLSGKSKKYQVLVFVAEDTPPGTEGRHTPLFEVGNQK